MDGFHCSLQAGRKVAQICYVHFQPRILQITFELHLRILGTYPEIQMGSVDMANLVSLLLRLGYRFITWVPNAAFLGIDVAELTLVLDS